MLTPELLDALLSPDAGIRSQAETVFQSIPVNERIQALMNQLLALCSGNNGHHDALSLLTAVLLRRDILKLADPSMLNDLVEPLLQCYGSPGTSASLKLQIGHCLAEACSSLAMITANSPTDAAAPVLARIIAAVNPSEEVSLQLLASLADRAPMSFANVAVASLPALVSSSNLASSTILAKITQVVVNGAIATTVNTVSLVRTPPNLDDLVVDETSTASELGTTCILPLLGPISVCNDQFSQMECLQLLSQAAVTCPSLLAGKRNILQQVIQMCLGVANNHASSSQGVQVALTALQVLTSLISVADIRHRLLDPAMAQQMAEKSIPICAQIMAHGMDNDSIQEWASEPATLVEDGMEDENDDALFAEALLESFLQSLASSALAVALPLVQQLLQSMESDGGDWRHARAGLAILESGLCAAPVSLAPHVPDIVKAAASIVDSSSSNPRLQYQAIRLLGALCETHSSVREVSCEIILARMAAALASPVSKVSSMASLGIVAFCRGNSSTSGKEGGLDVKDYLIPYLPSLMQALLQPLSLTQTDTGAVTVRVRAMNAVACLAEAVGDEFASFYPHISSGLLSSIQLPQLDIAGAALQTLTIVGQAVGKDVFQADATQVLSWIIPALPTGSELSSSFAKEELLSACARIASVLEEDFSPYVNTVLPTLYRQAEAPADISIVEGNEAGIQNENSDEVGDGIESMTVAIPGRGFKKVTINTTAIQEKASNNRIMYELCKALGSAFGPHVQTSLEKFLPLVRFQYSADVRSTAAQALSALFDCSCSYGEETGEMSIAQNFLPILSDAISDQIAQEDSSDMESLYASADSLSEIFYVVFRFRNSPFGGEILSGLSMDKIEQVVQRCIQTMTACLRRRESVTRILSGNLTGEDEKEEYCAQLRAEDKLLTPLVDSIGYLLKFTKVEFVPIFTKYIVPVLGGYLSTTADVRASVASMCLFDDCVEYCGQEAAATYSPPLLQGIMTILQDPSKYDRDLVQAAVYGISQIARHGPSNILAPHIQTIVHQLVNLSQGNKEDAGDDAYLHEISVSALASLTLFGPFTNLKFVNRDLITDVFLRNLPLGEDEDEAKICHAGLCTLMENGSININAEVARLTKIVGAILSDVQEGFEIASADTCERLMTNLSLMQHQNPQTMQQVYAGLDPDVQNVLGNAMQDFSQSRYRVVTPEK